MPKGVCTICLNLCEFIKTFVPCPCLNTINKISLVQFRNYSSATFDFSSPVTCITGANGSGKTNLLDAVYYLCYTKSYLSAYQQHSAQHGTDGFRIDGIFNTGAGIEKITCRWKAGKKEIFADGVEYEKPVDHIGKYSAVMIAPDDTELINDGSEQRRRWIDSILGQTDKEYLERLMNYTRVLQQRNAWLKMNALKPATSFDDLEFYNTRLHTDAAYIHQRRAAFLVNFMPLLQGYYQQLSGGKEAIHVAYESDLLSKPLSVWLDEGLQNDMRMQRTLRGIHKDDWSFILNEAPIRQFGSQGQKKSFLFALKLAQYAYISATLRHLPILLLDDIFEKLDQQRMEALLAIIRGEGFGQVMLTDTHAARVREALGATEAEFIHL